MKSLSVTIQMKATEQYFPVVLIIMLLCKAILTFESVDEKLSFKFIQKLKKISKKERLDRRYRELI